MSVGVHETSPRHRVGIKFLFSCVAWMNFLVSFCCLYIQIKNVKNATYYYWSWISLIFNHFAHSASRFCQLTFWLPLLAHFNMQRRKALLNCKQFTDREISTFSSNPLFPLSQLQFDTQLFSKSSTCVKWIGELMQPRRMWFWMFSFCFLAQPCGSIILMDSLADECWSTRN